MPSLVLARRLLCKAAQPFAAGELGPHSLGLDAACRPQGQQVVEHVGALAHELGLVAADALDQRLDRLLAQLLGDLLAAACEQPRRVRSVGIGARRPSMTTYRRSST